MLINLVEMKRSTLFSRQRSQSLPVLVADTSAPSVAWETSQAVHGKRPENECETDDIREPWEMVNYIRQSLLHGCQGF